jgi:hypothetical protein
MIATRSTLILSVGLVFVTGLAVGALGHRYYAMKTVRAQVRPPRDPDAWRKKYIGEMTTRLKLSSEQQQKLESILDQTHEKYRAMRERTRPEMDAIREGQVHDIEAILSAEQRVEYAKRRQEMEEKRKRSEGRPETPKS